MMHIVVGAKYKSHSLSIEGIGTRDDVGAVPAHQEVHPVIESL